MLVISLSEELQAERSGWPFPFKLTRSTSSNIYVDRFSMSNWTHSYTEAIIIMSVHKASHSSKTGDSGDLLSQITTQQLVKLTEEKVN